MNPGERTWDEVEDQRLIDGLLANDRESMAAVYDAFASVAYAVALRVLGQPAEAEDVLQESFLALWQQADRLDGRRGLRSYLLTIVHNKAVDRIRRRGRRPEAVLDPDAPFADPSEGPEDAAARSSDRERIVAAMDDLGEDQRQTLQLTYFSGLTIREVATQMKVPEGTVKSRLRLGLERLRRSLSP